MTVRASGRESHLGMNHRDSGMTLKALAILGAADGSALKLCFIGRRGMGQSGESVWKFARHMLWPALEIGGSH
ncbi:hypothetical protein D3C78_1679440 [compost metagenome]